jgi:hypothetical protein
MTVHVDRRDRGFRDRVDHGSNVLELTRHVVFRSVAAGTAATPVHGVYGRVRLQIWQ